MTKQEREKTPDDVRIETFMGATMSSPHDVEQAIRDMIADVRKDEQARLTKNPRHTAVEKCSCGLHEVPAGVGGVQWYWQLHTREKCTLELPNARCWCGLLRSEHLEGHGVPKPAIEAVAAETALAGTDAAARVDNVRRIRKELREVRGGTQNEMGEWLYRNRNLVDEMLCDRLRRFEAEETGGRG